MILWVKFQIRRCTAKHLSFLSRVRLRCNHYSKQCLLEASNCNLIFFLYKTRQLASWLQVSLKRQVQTGFQPYSSKKERKQSQKWFASWFNSSPWYATLISTLMGPLIILLLLLTFGPCVLNRLVAFVKKKNNNNNKNKKTPL